MVSQMITQMASQKVSEMAFEIAPQVASQTVSQIVNVNGKTGAYYSVIAFLSNAGGSARFAQGCVLRQRFVSGFVSYIGVLSRVFVL